MLDHTNAGGSRLTHSTISRKIHFYRWRVTPQSETRSFIPIQAASQIEQIVFQDRGRYLTLEDGNDLCVWFPQDNRSPGYVPVQLGVVRRGDLPQIEEGGRVSPLPIADTQGLVERTHLIFFPNHIIGAEFNFYGPRPARLAQYLHSKLSPALPSITLEILLRHDIEKRLDQLHELKLVTIRLHRSKMATDALAEESIVGMFQAQAEANDAPVIALTLRTEPYSKTILSSELFARIKTIFKINKIMEVADIFKIEAREDANHPFETLDLLKDQLVVSRNVDKLPGRLRDVDSDSVFHAIENAYGELQELLESAGSIGT